MLNRTCRVIHSHHLHKATKTCIYVHVYTYIYILLYIYIYIYIYYIAAPQALHFCTNLPRTISIDITDITSISSKNNASYKNYVFQRNLIACLSLPASSSTATSLMWQWHWLKPSVSATCTQKIQGASHVKNGDAVFTEITWQHPFKQLRVVMLSAL